MSSSEKLFWPTKVRLRSGFTLIELLVVIAIVATLAGLGHAAYSSAVGKAQMAAEIAAAKTLTSAYQAAAADNGGNFLHAYDMTATNVLGVDGKPLRMSLAGFGYPYRLAPYYNYAIDDTILVSGNKQQIQNMGWDPGTPVFEYLSTRYSSLGINKRFVGGSKSNIANDTPDPECVRRAAQASSSIIVFASAGASTPTGFVSGYGHVGAPSDDEGFKYVDARHDGKAVVAFLDGSTRLMTIDELKDMRLWSYKAAQANDPNYAPGK